MADTARAHATPRRDDARGEEAVFFEHCAAGEVRVQRCRRCATYVYPPRSTCPVCAALELDWVPISGAGTIHSFTEQFRPGPGFAGSTPYLIALVDLPEGIRMMGRLVADAPDVAIGDDVEVRIEALLEDWPVPVFVRPAGP